MRHLIKSLSVLLLLASAPGSAEETLREIPWTAVPEPRGTLLPPDGSTPFARLGVENARAQPTTVTVLTLERPPITAARYAIGGTVRYEGVEGTAFLEMWSVFPDGGRYFSRTLADVGPLGRLTGSSGWRPFLLPFLNREGAPPPTTLIVNVVLPGRGAVHLSPLRLLQYRPGEDPLASPGQWWGEETGGWLGAVAGSTAGLLGALIGCLAGMGRARRTALGLTKALIGVGAVMLLLGLWALARGQPYAVYYPLLLLGVIGSVGGAFVLPAVRRRYESLELRRMRAVDAR